MTRDVRIGICETGSSDLDEVWKWYPREHVPTRARRNERRVIIRLQFLRKRYLGILKRSLQRDFRKVQWRMSCEKQVESRQGVLPTSQLFRILLNVAIIFNGLYSCLESRVQQLQRGEWKRDTRHAWTLLYVCLRHYNLV